MQALVGQWCLRRMCCSLSGKVRSFNVLAKVGKRKTNCRCEIHRPPAGTKSLPRRSGGRKMANPFQALKSYHGAHSSNQVAQIHGFTVRRAYDLIVFFETALLNLYSKSSDLYSAHKMFVHMTDRNLVCWTALISSYVENGKSIAALQVFQEMQTESIEPDQVAITVALSACTRSGSLETGRKIHAFIWDKEVFVADVALSNALIDMYAKCGDIEMARSMFEEMGGNKDVTTWTCMIVGHALHGQSEESLSLFDRLEQDSNRLQPNAVTFIGVLMACSHGGLLQKGLEHLESMDRKYGLTPGIVHYGCIVDLFCRVGLLHQAFRFIMHMPLKPNAIIWRTLLGGCSLHGQIELGIYARKRVVELDPGNLVDHITMSNTFAACGAWQGKWMERQPTDGHRRHPGASFIELESRKFQFRAMDKSHSCTFMMYTILHSLHRILGTGGSALDLEECLCLNTTTF